MIEKRTYLFCCFILIAAVLLAGCAGQEKTAPKAVIVSDPKEYFPLTEGSVIDPIIALKQKKNICFTCFEDPYISEDGELIPCVRTKPMGGVDATVGFEKVWNHPRMLKFRKNMLQENYPSLCGKLCYVKEKK